MIPVMINDTPVDCINHAAIVYHVPASLILSVMKIENGRNGDAVRNKNGTFDYGVMQINDVWLPAILPYGYTKEDLQFNSCKNVSVGAWLISKNIAEGKAIWSGIANYHSKTPKYNKIYRDNIYKNYQKISQVLL